MLRRLGHLALIIALGALPATAFTEEALPPPVAVIEDAAWDLLAAATFEEVELEGRWLVRKTFPPALLARNNEEFTITGYMIPMDAGDTVTRLLLVRDAADCPFCGGGYGTVLEVMLDLGLDAMPEFSRLTVTGRLRLLQDEESTQMFFLENARAAAGG